MWVRGCWVGLVVEFLTVLAVGVAWAGLGFSLFGIVSV